MLCKCVYFHYVKDVLVCVQCGKPAHGCEIEDKIAERTEIKEIERIIPKGIKKVSRPKGR